jgi:hypothetical protein
MAWWWLLPSEVRLMLCAYVLMAALLTSLLALVLTGQRETVRVARVLAVRQAKLHLQQANIVGMLLRAGFRTSKSGRDWFDDAAETRGPRDSELDITEWDWRVPND